MKQTVKQGISPFYLTIIIKHLHIKANRLTFAHKKSKKKPTTYFLLMRNLKEGSILLLVRFILNVILEVIKLVLPKIIEWIFHP